MVVECDRAAEADAAKLRATVPLPSMPTRELTLPEKYAWPAALHRAVGDDVIPVDPYVGWQRGKGKSPGPKRMWIYEARRQQVARLHEDDRWRIEDALADVAAHLGLPNPLPGRMSAPTFVNVSKQQASQHVNLQPSAERNGTPARTQPKERSQTSGRGAGGARTNKRKRRGAAKRLTTAQEKVVEAVEAIGLSFSDIAEHRGCSPQAVHQLYDRARKNPAYKQRSIDLKKTKQFHANTRRKADRSDDE
jgi:hypothetical protein